MKSEKSPPKSEEQNISEALEAVQRMVLQMETDEAVGAVSEAQERNQCRSCGSTNPPANRFCARCGVPITPPAPESGASPAPASKAEAPGQHFYHHHYHHHFFAPAEATPGTVVVPSASRDVTRAKASGVGFSRAEAAVRKLSQDWAAACNTKHVEDLVELYAADAMVVRPNVPPVRTSAAIREYFVTALEAGLGDVELDPVRVEVFGEFAYEIGRCTMLVPGALGKRREERGKYVLLSTRQAGEWKLMMDSWSIDMGLASSPEVAIPRAPAKSA